MVNDLLEDLKKLRNDMVAKNYPYQQLTNLIYKWEDKLSGQKTESEKLQDNLEPIDE
tara:strand:- start:10619 stop:10789 length:171 start_codon:yes stop_codon:yes gene_type:complete